MLVQQGRIAAGTRTLEKPFDEETLERAVRGALPASHGTEHEVAPVS